jgi:hypothetical protein
MQARRNTRRYAAIRYEWPDCFAAKAVWDFLAAYSPVVGATPRGPLGTDAEAPGSPMGTEAA